MGRNADETGAQEKWLMISAILFLCLALLLLHSQISVSAREQKHAAVLTIKGAIGPATLDYFLGGVAKAADEDAVLIILEMDTPGGLDHSMRDIIKSILNSSIPVISYVAPSGSRAASAGTYILYASHLAAMAPATNLGAATPIQIGGLPGSTKPEEDSDTPKDEEAPPPPPSSTLERKMVNDAAAYMKSLASLHGRNQEWAEQAVREAVSLTAEEALELQVVEIVAANLQDLLRQADGREVVMKNGKKKLETGELHITRIDQSLKNKILSVIGDPNVAYILMLLGLYGLIYELANPGFFLPGVVGGISLLLALYAFQVLPINYSGLALIILGISFLVAEAFLPSFGSLGIGGIIAFATGSLILLDEESLRISIPLIAGTSLVSAAVIFVLMGKVVTMRKNKIRTGSEALAGMIGEAAVDFEGSGRMWLLGESWQVTTTGKVKKGDKLKVSGQEGLILQVTIEKEEP